MDPVAGPLQNPRLCLFQDGDHVSYIWQVYYSSCASGTYTTFSDVEEYLRMTTSAIFRVCDVSWHQRIP